METSLDSETFMTTRPPKSDSLRLAFLLLRHLSHRIKQTAGDLQKAVASDGIERNIRTIQRNLEMLCEEGFAECDDASKPYGYRLSRYAPELSNGKLSTQEALLLSLAENYLTNLLPANVTESLSTMFAAARCELNPTGDAEKARAWTKKVRVVSETQPLLPPKMSDEVFKNVTDALYNDYPLILDYYNAKQQQKTGQRVYPLGLAQQGPRLYLVCRFEGYDNERSIAVHRINRANVSKFPFTPPPDFDLKKYDDDGRFGFGEGERCLLTFNIKKSAGHYLQETPLSSDQTMTEHDDHYQVTATVIRSQQLTHWLDGFGELVWGVAMKDTIAVCEE